MPVLEDLINWSFPLYTEVSRSYYATSSEIQRLIIRASHLHGNEKVLDVGCGIGTLARNISPLLNNGGRVIGIDIDERLINYGRIHWGKVKNIELEVANAKNLPYADQSFDLVVSMGLIENCSDPKAIFNEMLRVARVPGKVLFTHIDIKNYRITPPEPHFSAFYRDLLKGMERIGVDLELRVIQKIWRDMHLIPRRFSDSSLYISEITLELISQILQGIANFYDNEAIIQEAIAFNHQFLKHVGWDLDRVKHALALSYNTENQRNFLMKHLGEEYQREVPFDLFSIELT